MKASVIKPLISNLFDVLSVTLFVILMPCISTKFVWPTHDEKFPVLFRFSKKFQAILKKSYKFQVILWNSWEFFGIVRKFHGEYIWVGIPWNSKSALCKLGIQSPNYPENSHLKFLGIPRNFFLRILRKLLVIVGIFKVTSKGLSQTDDCKCQSSRVYYER